MNEPYHLSNLKCFPARDCAGKEIKAEEINIESLIVGLEKMRYVGHMRSERRKKNGRLSWVVEHLNITGTYGFHRVPPPEKGEHVGRRGRKATGQGWALIAGLSKELFIKRQRTCQDFRAY